MQQHDGRNQSLTQPSPIVSSAEQLAGPKSPSLNGALIPAHATVAGAPAALSSTPTIGVLLLALRRRWLTAVILAPIAAFVAIAVVTFIFPPKYVTQAQLELTRPSRPVLSDMSVGDQDFDLDKFRINQQGIIKSPLVLSSALNNDKVKGLKVSSLPLEALAKDIKTDFTQGPEIMTVKLNGDDPDELAPMLNAIIQAYKEEIEKRDNQRKIVLLRQLEATQGDIRKSLAEQRHELHKLETDLNIPDPLKLQLLVSSSMNKVSSIDTMLRQMRTDLVRKMSDLSSLNSQLASIETEPIPPAKLKAALAKSPLIQQYSVDLAKVGEEINKWSSQIASKARDDAIDNLKEKRRAIEASFKETESALRPEFEKDLRSEMQEVMEQDRRKLEISISSLKTDEEALRKEHERAQAELREMSSKDMVSVTVNKLRDDVKQSEKIGETLAGRIALLKAEPPASSKIGLLQAAQTPTTMDFSRLLKYGTAGGMGAFCLVLFGIAFVEFRTRRINGAEEVIHGLSLPLVGIMPQLPARARRPIQGTVTGQDLHWQSIITESVDAIRTQLLHAARTDGVQIVMVTSAGSGEGKTSLASQLAASLARSWRKTLLVDGDLRNPAAHKLFDVPLEPGLCDVLRSDATSADAIKPTLLSRLWLLPAGVWDAHAVQALAQDGVHTMFDQLKEQYDFIVVDSCPVLPVADALLLGQHVDAVIFSVLRDVSRLPAIHAAQLKLQALGVRVLGAVVIGADTNTDNSVYRYTAQAGS